MDVVKSGYIGDPSRLIGRVKYGPGKYGLGKESNLFAFLILGSVFSDCVVLYRDLIISGVHCCVIKRP